MNEYRSFLFLTATVCSPSLFLFSTFTRPPVRFFLRFPRNTYEQTRAHVTLTLIVWMLPWFLDLFYLLCLAAAGLESQPVPYFTSFSLLIFCSILFILLLSHRLVRRLCLVANFEQHNNARAFVKRSFLCLRLLTSPHSLSGESRPSRLFTPAVHHHTTRYMPLHAKRNRCFESTQHIISTFTCKTTHIYSYTAHDHDENRYTAPGTSAASIIDAPTGRRCRQRSRLRRPAIMRPHLSHFVSGRLGLFRLKYDLHVSRHEVARRLDNMHSGQLHDVGGTQYVFGWRRGSKDWICETARCETRQTD